MAGSDLDEVRKGFFEARCEAAVKALSKRGFEARAFSSSEGAVRCVLDEVPEGSEVGAGGSVTLREMGLLDRLAARGDEVVFHQPDMEFERSMAVRKRAITCRYFLSSSNAVTMDGELVNTDGIGNRVCGMIFGPQTVFVLAGANKLVANREEAFLRLKHVAAPANARRLGIDSPCVKAGYCLDCTSPMSICRVTTIMTGRPMWTEVKVFLIAESLGL